MSRLVILSLLLASFTFAIPVRREVPQEHSHELFLTSVGASLNLDNPDGIQDPVFGLLGNAAGSAGAGKIADATCLQQATADRAFTNAKAAGDVQGQVDALIYRALERNTGKVGLASDPCTSIQAVNPEIAAIQQHQDPASPNAAAVNKAIVLELAKQIKAVGGNPLDAAKSGTFAPGDVNDPTGKGNSCDVIDDPNGCIFTQNLLVADATPEELLAAAGEAPAASTTAASTTAASTDAASTTAASTTAASTDSASTTAASTDSASTTAASTATATAEGEVIVTAIATCPPAATVTVTVDSAATASASSTTSTAEATATAAAKAKHHGRSRR